MLDWSLASEPVAADEEEDYLDPSARALVKCKVWLAYTSNLISAGTRESIRFLTKHRMVQVLVSSAGGVEEDFIKCLAPTFVGDFSLDGKALRAKGLNRIGNLVEPNVNYVKVEPLNPFS